MRENVIFKLFFVFLRPKTIKMMKKDRPLILISNDDGFRAKGINCLIEMLRPLGNVIVCAPEGARSGYSCAFSATSPLFLKKVREEEGLQVWSCSGTPIDCVKLALSELCGGRKPDLVVSGINHGDNASVNSRYSGTMGAVFEGAMKRIPSVAFSLCRYEEDADFSPMEPVVRSVVAKVLQEGMLPGVCLNVNCPANPPYKGIKICRMANGDWENEVVKSRHARGFDYYWLVGEYNNYEPEAEDTDRWALDHGYVAITPSQVDITNYETIDIMKDWKF